MSGERGREWGEVNLEGRTRQDPHSTSGVISALPSSVTKVTSSADEVVPHELNTPYLLIAPKRYNNHVVHQHQAVKQRRGVATVNILRLIIREFGTFDLFQNALMELQQLAHQYPDKFPLAPEILQPLIDTEAGVLQRWKKNARKFSPALITLAMIKRSQYALIRFHIPFLPCYRTCRRDWDRQMIIAACNSVEFFFHLERGQRCLLESRASCPVISITTMMRWILFLFDVCHGSELSDRMCALDWDFLLWADGAKAAGGIKGLFSGLRHAALSTLDAMSGKDIELPRYSLKWLTNRLWLLSISNNGETQVSVRSLECEQLRQWKHFLESGGEVTYKNLKLRPRLIGWTADHGYRLKSLSKDDNCFRCGECNWSHDGLNGSASFLDFIYLMEVEEINALNWSTMRDGPVPEHVTALTDLGLSTMTFDNLHNLRAVMNDLFDVTCSLLPTSEAKRVAKTRLQLLTGIIEEGGM